MIDRGRRQEADKLEEGRANKLALQIKAFALKVSLPDFEPPKTCNTTHL